MKKLTIFDLDGTLVNTLDDLGDSVNKALSSFGFCEHDIEKYRYFVGDGTLKLIERALPKDCANEETINSVHTLFSEIYSKNYLVKSCVYNGIKEVLSELKGRGFILAVATNKPDKFAREILDFLFGKDYFYCVYGKKDDVPKKPDPSIIHNILEYCSLKPEDAIMIGDSNVDVMTGKNAGLVTVGCLWGFRDYDELSRAGADYIASDPSDLFDIIVNA